MTQITTPGAAASAAAALFSAELAAVSATFAVGEGESLIIDRLGRSVPVSLPADSAEVARIATLVSEACLREEARRSA